MQQTNGIDQRLRVRQEPYILKIRSSNDSPAQTEVGGPELFIESFTGQEISIPIQSDNMCKRFDFEEDEDETKFVDWFQTWARSADFCCFSSYS